MAVPDELAGQAAGCVGCRQLITLPAAPVAASPPATPAVQPSPAQPSRSRGPVAALAFAGVVVLALGAGGVWYVRHSARPKPPAAAPPAAVHAPSAPPSPVAAPSVPTGRMAEFAVKQSAEDPCRLIVTGPWESLPKVILQVAYAFPDSGVSAESLARPPGRQEIEAAEVIKSMRGPGDTDGSTWYGFPLFWMVEHKLVPKSDGSGAATGSPQGMVVDGNCDGFMNDLGKRAGRVTYEVYQPNHPDKRAGRGAVFSDVTDWANKKTGALELDLHGQPGTIPNSDPGWPKGELCVTFWSPKGKKLAQATTQVDFTYHPPAPGAQHGG
jgi:hypothetical protein